MAGKEPATETISISQHKRCLELIIARCGIVRKRASSPLPRPVDTGAGECL